MDSRSIARGAESIRGVRVHHVQTVMGSLVKTKLVRVREWLGAGGLRAQHLLAIVGGGIEWVARSSFGAGWHLLVLESAHDEFSDG